VTELRRIAKDLRIGDGNRFADVGCGRGGPSLWVAARTGAALVGVDIAETALRAGRERANALALSDRATFVTGAFEHLPLDSEDLDGVMSIDALLFTADKAAALRELARVLRPGARLVLTTWDYDRQPDGRPPQLDDHRPLLQDAGFDVDAYEETVDWRGRQYGTTDRLLTMVDALAAESGADPDDIRAGLQEMRTSMDCMRRRVLIVAARRGR